MINQITVLSYNILEGLQHSEIQIDVFVKWVTDLNPDITFYQELNGFSEKSFAELTARCGHPFSVKIKEDGYRMGISSKCDITEIKRVTEGFTHGYIYAQTQGYHVFAVHLNPYKEDFRVQEIQKILAHAETLPKDAKTIIAGDFNSMAASDSAAYDSPEFLANRKAINPSFTLEFAVTNTMLEAGYTDAYSLFHTEFKHSCPSAKVIAPRNYGRRIDYSFLSPALKGKCISAEIVHDKITRYLSDHYPLVIKLKS